MKIILHNRISDTVYNVELAIIDNAYVVTYGRQVEIYELTAQGLARACQEYIECVDHAVKCESNI